ncbi:MAG TPA: GNAT family N-acetyltransferase [Rhizomicrobium sp.]|nr:GNAT family N-acetyltransferase [Rhizomicrobium sp.]
MSEVTIRRAEQGDLPALLDIYNHYVVHTPVNFDLEPHTLQKRQEWFDQFKPAGRYQCFTAVKGAAPVGYVCSARFKEKAAYDTTIETSIYVAPGEGGKGVGRRLYEVLFDALKGEDIHRAYGGITMPNDASVAVHRAMGFEHVGTYGEVGRKFGRYWDVALYLKPM